MFSSNQMKYFYKLDVLRIPYLNILFAFTRSCYVIVLLSMLLFYVEYPYVK